VASRGRNAFDEPRRPRGEVWVAATKLKESSRVEHRADHRINGMFAADDRRF
jgi:hypothetical protein